MTRPLVLLLALCAPGWLPAAAGAEPVTCATLPGNIVVPDGHEAWFEALIADSATLQRQCRAIASAERVVVLVTSVGGRSSCCRARTTFIRDRTDALRAIIDLPVSVDVVELLAHEFEHVVEQIEGVNLRRLARRPDSGVRVVGPGRFETDRACRAGLEAAAEVRASDCRPGCGVDVLLVAARD